MLNQAAYHWSNFILVQTEQMI